MANGKIRDNNHIVEEKSLNFLKNLFPFEWVHHKIEPDYGIDIDLELFDYENDVCVTLGEHVFFKSKGQNLLNMEFSVYRLYRVISLKIVYIVRFCFAKIEYRCKKFMLFHKVLHQICTKSFYIKAEEGAKNSLFLHN